MLIPTLRNVKEASVVGVPSRIRDSSNMKSSRVNNHNEQQRNKASVGDFHKENYILFNYS